jgi:FkbM family methyltransferase
MQPSPIAEFVMNHLILCVKSESHRRVQKRVLAFARNLLAKRKDMYVRYELGGSKILLPRSHNLPLVRAAFPQYSTNIARLCGYMAEKYPDLHLVDIGANVGDTVAIVREHSQCPILCVEADELYFGILSENLQRANFHSVQAVRAFVATYTGQLQGDLVSAAGTAHFVNASSAPWDAVRLSDLLNDFPRFQTPKILKIDTDGFDCCILRSELEWLSKQKPVIFFEYDPFFFRNQQYDGTRIFEDLSVSGYTFAIIYDNFGDLLTAVDLKRDGGILADLQNYCIGRNGHQYADVVVFHNEDRDIAEHIRRKETEWSLQWRKKWSSRD